MTAELRTVVTFKTTRFNSTEEKPYFINPGCFGDDVLRWMKDELKDRGAKTADEPGQEDFGWYLNFEVAGLEHTFVVGFRPGDAIWIGWVERSRGFIGSILGRRKRGIDVAALEVLHNVLASSPEIKDVRWHSELAFEKDGESGWPNPIEK